MTMTDGGATNEKPRQIKLQIQLDEETAQGIYANLAMVHFTETEFAFDFIYVQPQQPKAKVRARVLSNPIHAKRLLLALQDSVRRYESRFGEIELAGPTPEPSGYLQ